MPILIALTLWLMYRMGRGWLRLRDWHPYMPFEPDEQAACAQGIVTYSVAPDTGDSTLWLSRGP